MILAVGRLAARKGYVSLLRALPLILKEHENAKLVIVGRGHMKKKLLKVADELGVRESLFIQSAMSFEDFAQHYRSADLVVFPSCGFAVEAYRWSAGDAEEALVLLSDPASDTLLLFLATGSRVFRAMSQKKGGCKKSTF